ncbi:hypothetical protein DFJ77DRAFT_533294 [Powellomyces hirtus]|nr:hypothetical protein DFJ77DRAFT_533294 [Powellomyces hirtus]
MNGTGLPPPTWSLSTTSAHRSLVPAPLQFLCLSSFFLLTTIALISCAARGFIFLGPSNRKSITRSTPFVTIFRFLAALHAIFYLTEMTCTTIFETEPYLAAHHAIALGILACMTTQPKYIMVLSLIPYWLHALYHAAGGYDDFRARLILPYYCGTLLLGGVWSAILWLKGMGVALLPALCILEVFVNYKMQCADNATIINGIGKGVASPFGVNALHGITRAQYQSGQVHDNGGFDIPAAASLSTYSSNVQREWHA